MILVTGKNINYLEWTFTKMNKQIIPNDAIMKYYFYFIEERMNMFWRKIEGGWNDGWSRDPIFKTYKFTNVYRATDRVSQYLIRNVIYKNIKRYKPEDILLRILVFKIFNLNSATLL